jgi:hypothetical protein
MKSYVSKNEVYRLDLDQVMTYKDNFSYEGLDALFDWLEEYEDGYGAKCRI